MSAMDEYWELHDDVLDTEESIGISQEQAEQLVAEGVLVVWSRGTTYKLAPGKPRAMQLNRVRVEEVCDL